MARLGVNIDHIATLRQARGGHEPDPIAAAVLADLGGADGLVVHLREDRRHIQERDLTLLRDIVPSVLNLEMAADRRDREDCVCASGPIKSRWSLNGDRSSPPKAGLR